MHDVHGRPRRGRIGDYFLHWCHRPTAAKLSGRPHMDEHGSLPGGGHAEQLEQLLVSRPRCVAKTEP